MAEKKAAAKKATGGRKYSPAASASVEREMKAMKQGKLRSGSGDKVTNPKQAIAIGLSEARREGDEAPTPPKKRAAAKKAPAKKSATKSTPTSSAKSTATSSAKSTATSSAKGTTSSAKGTAKPKKSTAARATAKKTSKH